MPGNNRYARVCAGQSRSEKFSRGILAAVFFRAPKKAKNVAEALERLRQIFGKTRENGAEFCCFPGWSWYNGYITAIFRAQFAAERIMPGYARGLQNPDYAPNYAIMPEHNGEDPRLSV